MTQTKMNLNKSKSPRKKSQSQVTKNKNVIPDLRVNYSKTLQKKPEFPRFHLYQWADYIELLCLANMDCEISKADIVDRLSKREKDLQEGDSKDFDETSTLEEESGGSTRRAEVSDKWMVRSDDWFRVLSIRPALYGEHYPFLLSENEITRSKKLTIKQKGYIYLLICSNLYLFDKSTQVKLANCFELLCFNASKNIMPSNCIVSLFGSNALNNDDNYGKGKSLWEKLNILKENLCENLHPGIKEINYPSNNKGDDGLDIIGLIPTNDNLSSKLIFFGQCTCEDDWWKKASDSSFDSWSNKISFTNYPSNMLFIPYCYRGSDTKWFNQGKIPKTFLVDRKRLLSYLDIEIKQIRTFPIYHIVEEVIRFSEPLF